MRRERFDYTGGRVTTIHEDEFAERLGADDEAVSRIRLDIDYDDQGAVERIVWNVEHKRYFPDSVGDRGVTFRRSSPTAVRRARAVRDELPARIAAWARRQDPSEPVCCLALLYNPDAYDVLPSLGLLTDRERRTFVVDTPAPTLNAVLWNPAEWEHFDAAPDVLADDTLQTAAHLLAQEWDAALDDRQPRTTLLRCVRQLQDDDWASILPLAPTFAIYAVDLELCDVDRNLTATVPAATRRALLTGGD